MFVDIAVKPCHYVNFDDVVKTSAAKKACKAFLNK